jgi:hypothetical protein
MEAILLPLSADASSVRRMLTFIAGQMMKLTVRWLNTGNADALLRMCSKDMRFVFPGRSPLSGDFRGKPEIREWIHRWHALGAVLQVHSFAVGGWPWNLRLYYRFTDTIPIPGKPDYVRSGSQFIRIKWGVVREYWIFVDDPMTEVVEAGLL